MSCFKTGQLEIGTFEWGDFPFGSFMLGEFQCNMKAPVAVWHWENLNPARRPQRVQRPVVSPASKTVRSENLESL